MSAILARMSSSPQLEIGNLLWHDLAPVPVQTTQPDESSRRQEEA